MREFTSALLRWPMAASLFGLSQLAALAEAGEGVDRATRNFYQVTQATQDRLGDVTWAAYEIGDTVQREAVDLVANATDGTRWRRTLAQLSNNIAVYRMVKNVDAFLDIPSDGLLSLPELVARAYALGQYLDLWAIEGLGHVYTDRWLDRGERPRNILAHDVTGHLPQSSLTMLHAGVGLAAARHVLVDATPYDAPAELCARVETFLALCRENARPGYAGAAIESLGLVARTWHAQLMSPLDAALSDVDSVAREHFWHGAGRALYFHPLYIVPGLLSPWRATVDEPPDAIATLNMKAGLAWATMLVNIRQPEILAHIVAERGAWLEADDGFASGIAAATVMASDVTPAVDYAAALCAWTPPDDLARRWESLINRPCRIGFRAQPALARAEHLGEVFRYQAFPGWFEDHR